MTKSQKLVALTVFGLIVGVGLSALMAQDREPVTPELKGKEVVLVGTIVDLQCYMTGQPQGKDPAGCARDCIRAGVPAALETKDGLVVIGMGTAGPAKKIVEHALAVVEIKGKLYEKGGLRYIDLRSVEPAEPPTEEEFELEEYGDEDWDEEE